MEPSVLGRYPQGLPSSDQQNYHLTATMDTNRLTNQWQILDVGNPQGKSTLINWTTFKSIYKQPHFWTSATIMVLTFAKNAYKQRWHYPTHNNTTTTITAPYSGHVAPTLAQQTGACDCAQSKKSSHLPTWQSYIRVGSYMEKKIST